MSLDEYLKMALLPYLKAQLVEHVRETCYIPHSITSCGVPKTKHNS